MPRIAFRIAPESQIYLRCRQTRDREKPCIDSFHNRNTNWRISSRQSLQWTESNFTIKETLINFSTLLLLARAFHPLIHAAIAMAASKDCPFFRDKLRLYNFSRVIEVKLPRLASYKGKKVCKKMLSMLSLHC